MALQQIFCQFTGSAAQKFLGFLVSKKFLEEKIFAGTNFCELAFDHENCENFCLVKISRYTVVYVAVLGRSQTLFHCVFRTRYHVWSAVMQNFYEGQDSYALHRCTNTWLVHYCMQFINKISLFIGVGNCAVTCMWPACDLHVTCMWPACDLHVTCMWPACDLHVANNTDSYKLMMFSNHNIHM